MSLIFKLTRLGIPVAVAQRQKVIACADNGAVAQCGYGWLMRRGMTECIQDREVLGSVTFVFHRKAVRAWAWRWMYRIGTNLPETVDTVMRCLFKGDL